jgi:hypothetical protein
VPHAARQDFYGFDPLTFYGAGGLQSPIGVIGSSALARYDSGVFLPASGCGTFSFCVSNKFYFDQPWIQSYDHDLRRQRCKNLQRHE